MSSMIEKVKELSAKSHHEELVCTGKEYETLITELWNLDEYLKNRYVSPSTVPRIYSLYGVKILVI